MLGFFRKASSGGREQLLEGIPMKNELARAKPWGKGLRITAPLRENRMRRIFGGGARNGLPAEKTFELDDLGAWVWNQVNGKRTVRGLIEEFAAHFRVNLREAEVSVAAFLKMLAQRNLIGIVAGVPQTSTDMTSAATRRTTTSPRSHEAHEGPRRRRRR